MRADVNMNQNVTDWRDFFNDFKKRDLIDPVFEPPPAIDIGADKSFFAQYKHEYASFWKDGGAINVWEAAGLKRDEVRNTAVLSWLLDCHGSHGQGSLFLECFLESLQCIPENEKALALNIDPHYLKEAYRTIPERVFLENAEDGLTHNRVDIVIEGEAFLLFIEVKIGAGEGDNQLKRYAQIMQSCAENKNKPCGLVFLTQDGRTDQNETEGVATLSWKQFAYCLEKKVKDAINKAPDSRKLPLWIMPVLQFCQHIRTFF